jgi:hypothetical protein
MTHSIQSIFLGIGLLLVIQANGFAAENAHNPDADYAQVKSVRMVSRSDRQWDFHVSVFHNDEGWDHYANVWQIVNPADDTVIGERVLAHPHDTEQPFTRSLTGVTIPNGTGEVVVRSRCNLHEYGGKDIRILVPTDPQKGMSLTVSVLFKAEI